MHAHTVLYPRLTKHKAALCGGRTFSGHLLNTLDRILHSSKKAVASLTNAYYVKI